MDSVQTTEDYPNVLKIIKPGVYAIWNKYNKKGLKKMGEMLEVELLGLPPTVNHMYRSGKGIRYKTLEVRQYQQYVVGKLREAWTGRETLMGRIEMHVVFTTNDRRRWDIDNRVKALQDCLSMAGVIRDDSQLDDLRVQRIYGKDKGTRITVRESAIK